MKIIQPISLWSWLSLISLGALASDYGKWHKDFDIKPDHQKILVNQLNGFRNAFSTGGISGNGKNFRINDKTVYATKLPSLTWDRDLAGRAKMTAGNCRTISEQNQPGVTISSSYNRLASFDELDKFEPTESTMISFVQDTLIDFLGGKIKFNSDGTVTCTEKPAACQMFLAAIADQSTKIGCGAATCKEAIQSDSNSSRENIASFYCMFNSAPDVNQVPFSYSFEKSEIASQCETTVEKFQLCGEPPKKPPAATRPVKSALINSLPIESSSFQEKLANRFNKIRHLVADGNIFAKQFPNFQVDNQVIQATNMPDLSWSAELAKESQQIADQCTVIRPRDEIPQKSYAYSMNATALENLTAEEVENNQDFHGKLVVDWIYNYLKDAKNKFNADGSFSCYGIDQTDIMSCRKFLSLISDQTTSFGCGVAACSEITMGRRPVIANVMNFVCTFDNLPEVEQIPYAYTVKPEVVEEEKPVSISSGLSANRNLVQPVEIGDDSVTLSAERYKELMTAQAVAKQLEAIVALMHLL